MRYSSGGIVLLAHADDAEDFLPVNGVKTNRYYLFGETGCSKHRLMKTGDWLAMVRNLLRSSKQI